jgi:hypothetical protein
VIASGELERLERAQPRRGGGDPAVDRDDRDPSALEELIDCALVGLAQGMDEDLGVGDRADQQRPSLREEAAHEGGRVVVVVRRSRFTGHFVGERG